MTYRVTVHAQNMAAHTSKVDNRPAQTTMAFEDAITPDEIREADEALAFLRKEVIGDEHRYVDEKALLHKIDWMVMPLMFCCYLLEYLDKSLCRYLLHMHSILI
jgi:hypothetical protein